jgi:hypothetical protein
MKIGRFVHGTKEFPERRMKKDEFLLFGLFFARLEVGSVHIRSIKFGFSCFVESKCDCSGFDI